MKNVINYYYNILFNDIHQTNKNFYFNYQNEKYFFILFEGNIENLQNIYNLHNQLLKRGIYVHQIILNKDGQIITFVSGNPYIMLKTKYENEDINLNHILFFSQILVHADENYDLKKLWIEKNDHLEYQITHVRNRYPLISESFDYFIGLGENSIQLLGEISNINYPKVIAHKRIASNDTTFDLYNPLNLIVDTRIRDVAEYFKSNFFAGKNIDNELKNFLNNAKLTQNEYYLFLARMLYPTYYFDMYEEIINGKKKEEDINTITNKIHNYEKVLRMIYIHLKNIIMLPTIEWLETI